MPLAAKYRQAKAPLNRYCQRLLRPGSLRGRGDPARLRGELADALVAKGSITDESVEAAFWAVPGTYPSDNREGAIHSPLRCGNLTGGEDRSGH